MLQLFACKPRKPVSDMTCKQCLVELFESSVCLAGSDLRRYFRRMWGLIATREVMSLHFDDVWNHATFVRLAQSVWFSARKYDCL